jgi:hypothetical protein
VLGAVTFRLCRKELQSTYKFCRSTDENSERRTASSARTNSDNVATVKRVVLHQMDE